MVFIIKPNSPAWLALIMGMISAGVAAALSWGIFFLTNNPDPVLPLGLTAIIYGILQSIQQALRNKNLI